MKKRVIIILVLVLVWISLFVSSAFVVIHSGRQEVAKVQDEIPIENEVNTDDTVSDIANNEVEESNNNEQTNENVSSNNVENKIETNTPKPTTATETKENTKVTMKESNNQSNQKTQIVNNPQPTTQTQQNPQIETKVEQPKSTETNKTEEKLKCVGNKHFMEVGNSNKWFNTEAEAVAYYKSIIKTWGDKLESFTDVNSEEFKAFSKEYDKNCPYGYEDWSCICGKWTINFYYN